MNRVPEQYPIKELCIVCEKNDGQERSLTVEGQGDHEGVVVCDRCASNLAENVLVRVN